MLAALAVRPLPQESEDWSTFISLLLLANLPLPESGEPARFFAVEDEVGLVGFGGLEGSGCDQLLRSLVTVPGLRRRGLGPFLASRLVEQAKRDGAERLWLLTSEAAEFFAELGWVPVERDSAPQAVRQSRLFRDLCPATAVLMSRSLG